MASLLERIASFPAQIIAELKKINEKLAEIYTTYESAHKKDECQPVVLNATLSRPEAEETEDKRHHGAVESFQDRYLFIQIGGLFITMVIAIATLLSAKAAKDAAFASQEQAKAALLP